VPNLKIGDMIMYCSVRVIAHFKGFMIDIINMTH
jgi:hypothetical protein